MKIKTTFFLILCAAGMTAPYVYGQAVATPPPPLPARAPAFPLPGGDANASKPLTKFNLDFRGGSPANLVAAIEAATGHPLNAIIPEDLAGTQLPALRMNNVNASQLFNALMLASRKNETVKSGYGNYQVINTAFGFRTDSNPSDDTIWYFFVEKPAVPPPADPVKICRFYSLAPYLDDGLKVDDITTAIETGWKMLGVKPTPAISFHKDTKLLIAVGEERKLEMINDVLKALEKKPAVPMFPSSKTIEAIVDKKLSASKSASETNKPAVESKSEK